MVLHQEVWVSFSREGELCKILEEMLTRNLQQGARSIARMDRIGPE